MSGIEQFENQSYLSLQTYRKNGDAMPTPVWFVQAGDQFYVRTIAGSGKVKRIHNNPNIKIMPCGRMGEPLGTWIAAQANEILDEETFTLVRSLLAAKYGEPFKTMEAQTQASGQKYTVLLIKPEN